VRRRPDTELIALARQGSADAAGALFDRYWTFAWKAAYAQDAIQRAFSALDRFDEMRPFGPWLKRIAVNRAIDLLRRDGGPHPLEDDDATLHAWALGEHAEEDVRLWGVTDAVSALDPPKRAVVVLHYWLDLSVEEIAGVLGLPVGTVASRLSRALSELRLALTEERVA